VISLDEAAERLGVHYMTAYRYVRTGRLPARNVGGRWEVDERDLARLTRTASRRARRGEPDWKRTRARLLATLVAGDEEGAWTLVDNTIAAGAAPADIHLEALAPSLRKIGDLWERGDIDVADEHRAAAVATRIVARLGPRFRPRGRRSGVVLAAGVEGDHHALPVALLTDLLRAAGFRVVDLGADAPADAILRALDDAGPADALCITVSTNNRYAAARRAVRRVRAGNADLMILVGGPAVPDAATAESLGSDGFAPDGVAAAALIRERLTSVRRR
jgi:excisionase family DNA binding protein